MQRKARSNASRTGKPAPTAEYLTRHALESFLDRLSRTEHAGDFVLKGGILLAVYGVRRPTRDVDVGAISSSVTTANIGQVVRDAAAVEADDGRDLRRLDDLGPGDPRDRPVRRATNAGQSFDRAPLITVAWDISTGDPIVPLPELVSILRVLGQPIEILGYAPETVVAEKGVTILERGITNTRWRDYVDIVRLAEDHGLDQDLLLQSARAVARYRQVELGPITPAVVGYGAVGQAKWAVGDARRASRTSARPTWTTRCQVACMLDPVFGRAAADSPSAVLLRSVHEQ